MNRRSWRGHGSRGYPTRGRGGPERGSRSPRGHSYEHSGQREEHFQHSWDNQRSRGVHRGPRNTFRPRGAVMVNYGRGQQHSWDHARHHSTRGLSTDTGRRQTHRGYRGRGGGRRDIREQKQNEKFLDFPFLEQHNTVCLVPQFCIMFILRGLPGSGKSTIADAILQQYNDKAVVCSADYYRYNKDGEYVWHGETLQETHKKCQRRAEKFCGLKKPVVIIDNTNVIYSEMEPYINLAKQHGYVTVLVEPKTPWKFQAGELAQKNAHSVSFTKISKRIEQYEDVAPLYFAWFLSQQDYDRLHSLAKDILWKCLQIPDFQQCIKEFSGHSASRFTVHNALSYYSMKRSDQQDQLHVTACFSPRGKYLAGSPYHKSPEVEKALGDISFVSITGWVITRNTVSARISLTKQQQKLWMNDGRRSPQRKTAHTTWREEYVEETTSSLQHLRLKGASRPPQDTELKADYGSCAATTHITLGKAEDVSPVQAKYDVQTVINHELSSCEFEEYALHSDIGNVRSYMDNVWGVYLSKSHFVKVPAIFSGYYE